MNDARAQPAPSGSEAWLAAGQTLLRRGGIAAVKLQALTEETGLTTGSFYHHFTAMGSYIEALASYYGSPQAADSLVQIDHPDPRTRLRRLHARSVDEHMAPLDAAMRDWAGSNVIAARAVREADAVMLGFVEQAFIDLGFHRRAARVRALLFFSAGVARIHPPWPVPSCILEDVMAVLTTGAG